MKASWKKLLSCALCAALILNMSTVLAFADGEAVDPNGTPSVSTEGEPEGTEPETPEDTNDGEGGSTEGGNTEGGNTEGGNTEGGNTEGGNTEGGNTEGGNSTPLVPLEPPATVPPMELTPAAPDVMPMANGEVTISNVEDLANAIKNQAENQIWKLAAGTYELTQTELDVYKDYQYGGQGNWYFPIHANGIHIIGEGQVTITTNVTRNNGEWSSQDFVSVSASGVTIENVDFTCKQEINKAIEVMSGANNFTLKDCTLNTIDVNGKKNSGSIYINDGLSGVSISNVDMASWIRCGNSTVTLTDVTMDFSDHEYSNVDDGGYYYFGANGTNVTSNGVTVKVNGSANFTKQVTGEALNNTDKIVLTGDVKVDEMVRLNQPNLTLDLGGHTISASSSFTGAASYEKNIIEVSADSVVVENGVVEVGPSNQHGINVFEADDVKLNNLTIDHTGAGIGGAPIIINNSDVNVGGSLNLKLGSKSWYGINVDPKNGSASLTFDTGSHVTAEGTHALKPVIKQNGNKSNITITGAKDAGLIPGPGGTYVIDPDPVTPPTPIPTPDPEEDTRPSRPSSESGESNSGRDERTPAQVERDFWKRALSKVRSAKDGSSLRLFTGIYDEIPADVINAIRENGLTVTFYNRDGLEVTVDGSKLPQLSPSATLAVKELGQYALAADEVSTETGASQSGSSSNVKENPSTGAESTFPAAALAVASLLGVAALAKKND